MKYPERRVSKAIYLLDELIDEIHTKHAFKLVVVLWEIIELLLRALVYLRLKTTYEKPQKLIYVLINTC